LPSLDNLDRVITLSNCIEAAIIIDGGDEAEPPLFSTSATVSKKCVATAWNHTGTCRNISSWIS